MMRIFRTISRPGFPTSTGQSDAMMDYPSQPDSLQAGSMREFPSRRDFTRTALATLAFTTSPKNLLGEASNDSITTISQQPQYYHGWPTVTRTKAGELIAVWSGRREGHVCPFGTVEMMMSRDEGRSWTYPRTIHDGLIDDRDAGVLETSQGTILVTSFSSLAYLGYLDQKRTPELIRAWDATHARLPDDAARTAELGCWAFRSSDQGRTFPSRIDTIVNSPHGPCQLSDGRLLYLGKRLWEPTKSVGAAESHDDGVTWSWLSPVPARPGDDPAAYHELHAVECASGKILGTIRNHNDKEKGETLLTHSLDGGKSWSIPQAIGVWGLPAHLLRLRDGRVLMSYGYRRKPYGNQARLSSDEGETWSEPITISSDGDNSDLGYPSTVELADGSFLSIWYERMRGEEKARLRQARWQWTG
jgi:sialidase-1